MDLKEAYSSWENLLIIVASVVLIIAAFLTWVSGSFSAELIAPYVGMAPNLANLGSLSGVGIKFGYVSAACGLAALLLFFFKKSKVFTIILGVIAFLIGGLMWLYTSKVIPSIQVDVVMKNGPGVYLTMISAVALVIGGFLMKKSDKKKK